MRYPGEQWIALDSARIEIRRRPLSHSPPAATATLSGPSGHSTGPCRPQLPFRPERFDENGTGPAGEPMEQPAQQETEEGHQVGIGNGAPEGQAGGDDAEPAIPRHPSGVPRLEVRGWWYRARDRNHVVGMARHPIRHRSKRAETTRVMRSLLRGRCSGTNLQWVCGPSTAYVSKTCTACLR